MWNLSLVKSQRESVPCQDLALVQPDYGLRNLSINNDSQAPQSMTQPVIMKVVMILHQVSVHPWKTNPPHLIQAQQKIIMLILTARPQIKLKLETG